MKTSARLTWVVTLAAILGAPVSAFAQSADNKVQAEALFEEGRKLMDEQHYDEACKKLEGSQKLDPGAGTLLNLAACYEKNGQTASAWVTYKDAAAASAGRHQDWADQANAKAAELEPKLSHLTITVSVNIANLEITRDGAVVPSPTIGAAIPIDSGPHTVEAHAPGYKPFITKITIGASQDAQTITVPALEADATAPSANSKSPGSGQKILGGALVGVGAVGLVVGSVFGVVALNKKSTVSSSGDCNTDFTVCTQAGKDQVDSAKSAGFISTVTLIGGGVFVAAGAVIFLTAPRAENKPEGATIQARLGATGSPAGLSFGGSF